MNLWNVNATFGDVALSANDEIGVFDGNTCVGVGVVTAPISTEHPLIITTSQNDGAGNGFTPGHPITFKVWNSDTSQEFTQHITAEYFDVSTGNPITPPNFEANGDYGLKMSVNLPPAIHIVEPNGQNDTANSSYAITWTDDDPGDDALITLHYDTDNAGVNGTRSPDCDPITEDNETDRCTWNTAAIVAGTYYVYAVIADNVNAPVIAYSPGTVTIQHPTPTPSSYLLWTK